MNAANEINASNPEIDHFSSSGQQHLGKNLWAICCKYTRPVLDNMAQRMPTLAEWDDIVLPSDHLDILKEIAMHVKYRSKVYKEGKFDQKNVGGALE